MKIRKPGVDIDLLIISTVENTGKKVEPVVEVILIGFEKVILIANCKDLLHAIAIRDTVAKEILTDNNWVFRYRRQNGAVDQVSINNMVEEGDND
jgi:hypothetical protein